LPIKSFGAIFETKPAPALAVGIQFIGSTASDRKSVVRLVGLCPLFQSKYCLMNNNSVVNGYDYLTNSFPKETPPLDKDRILGIAKSSRLENPDFTSAVNYLRGEPTASDGLFLSITLVLPVKMEYVYKRLPLIYSKHLLLFDESCQV
jgi:hypothetical protein